MNILFFGGWFFASLALLLGLLLLVIGIAETFFDKPLLRISGKKFESALSVGVFSAAVALIAQFVVGTIALWKGWFW